MSASDKASTPAPNAPLPTLSTHLPADEVIARLDRASLRGHLPGFESYASPDAFSVDAFGAPFDETLHGRITPAESGEGSTIGFNLRVQRKFPVLFAASIVVSIWPGLPLTDSLIPGAWGWWPTWMWYLPLTILPLVWAAPRMWRKSRRAARQSAHEAIEKIAKQIAASVTDAGAEEQIDGLSTHDS